MEKAKIIEKLIKDHGYNIKEFAAKCGIPYSTLHTILGRGVGGARLDTVITICEHLGITIEELNEMARGTKKAEYEPTYEDIQSLIARNGRRLTLEQKSDIIKTLLSDD